MIRAVAAIDARRGLATDAGIPWKLPSEQAHERLETKGGNMLMGYNTYLEFSKAPPERHWFVVAEESQPVRGDFEKVTDLKAFMQHPPENLWLFGGAGVFAQTIDHADELYLTRIEGDFGCTKFFPEFEDKFELVQKKEPRIENGTTFHYEIWKRKR